MELLAWPTRDPGHGTRDTSSLDSLPLALRLLSAPRIACLHKQPVRSPPCGTAPVPAYSPALVASSQSSVLKDEAGKRLVS
jgi:hypothetical protein